MDKFKEYIKYVHTKLEEDKNGLLCYYEHLNKCMEFYNEYYCEISNTLKENTFYKEKVLKIFFDSSILYFTELSKSVRIGNYISASCILRILVENYILITYIHSREEKISKYFWYFPYIVEYIKAGSDNFLSDYNISSQDKKEILTKCSEILKSMSTDYKEYLGKNKPVEKLINRTRYGWVLEFKDQPSLKLIANSVSLDEEYEDFEKLSSSVHSNDTNRKIIQLDIEDQEFDTIYFYTTYIEKYLALYLDIYKIDSETDSEMQDFIHIMKIGFDEFIKSNDADNNSNYSSYYYDNDNYEENYKDYDDNYNYHENY